ncbi:MAG TPA: ABC transporter substrate-binding protein [Candidatus Binatia bacterium]
MMHQLGTVSAFVVFVLAFFAAFADAADKIRISVSSLDTAFLTPAVALKRGFFKEEDIDAEVIRMNANVSVTALSTGDIDYTTIFGSVVRAAMRGLPVRVVASFLDSPTQMLLARQDFKSVKELKGKTLGVSTFGATADVAARMMFKYSGVDPEKEIKIIALGADQARFTALKEGIVDVVVISPPADVEGKKFGFRVLARAYELFNFPFVGLGANLKKISDRPDEIKRVIKALIKANRYIRGNRDGSIHTLMEWGRTSKENAALSYDSVVRVFNADGSIPDDGLQAVIEAAAKDAKITRQVAVGEVADLTLVREAQKELGIKAR